MASIDASKNSGRESLKHGGAHATLSEVAERAIALRERVGARSRSKGAPEASVGTCRDESYIAALLSLVASLKDEGLASVTWTLSDCVPKADDVCCSGDIEVIKQLIHDIDSVIGNISSLYKIKDLHSMFNEMSHIADVTSDRLNLKLSYLGRVSDLDQRLFSTGK